VYLFDTDALSEVFKKRPAKAYLSWLQTVPKDEQFVSAVSVGELFEGAYRSSGVTTHLHNIRARVLPAVTVLPYDVAVAEVFGKVSAALRNAGTPLADPDLQIAATALYHGLELVTGNIKHFSRVPKLTISDVFAKAR
jgi:tRNA(fMet)-specific endonuclease VapC